jgi:hypothetical protein
MNITNAKAAPNLRCLRGGPRELRREWAANAAEGEWPEAMRRVRA